MKRTLLILAALSPLVLTACSEPTPTTADADSYKNLCIQALIKAQDAAPALKDASVSAAAGTVAVLDASSPQPRIQCAVGSDSVVTFDAYCSRWEDQSCAHLVSAVADGRVVYLSQEAADAMRAAGAAHHHHRHH